MLPLLRVHLGVIVRQFTGRSYMARLNIVGQTEALTESDGLD